MLHNLVNPIREVEGGKEIQQGKAQRPRAQEEGDEEGEASQEGKGQKTRAKARPGSDGSPTASFGRADPRWFQIGERIRDNPDFVAMDPESLRELEADRTWLEWKAAGSRRVR